MIALLNGSPKAGKGNSSFFLDRLEDMLSQKCVRVSAREEKEESFSALCCADAVVLAFPLYVDALPSHLLRFLMGLERYAGEQTSKPLPRFYAVAQCGFMEGEQNRYALDVLAHFCRRSGFSWCGGLGLGGGGAAAEVPSTVLRGVDRELCRLAEALQNGRALPENRYAALTLPRWTYSLAGGMGWVSQARKNGLRKRDLYRKE